MNSKLFAPELDNHIEMIIRGKNLISPEIWQMLKDIYDRFCCIEPGKDDEI